MIIEAVLVSVNYGDFLAWTLPHNKRVFDRLVVVTDEKDSFTKRVCDFYNVKCIQTNVFYENNHSFNKAAGINAGLSSLTMADWVIHLDADIFLFQQTRSILNNSDLDKKCIYGIDRLMCNSFDDWINFLSNPISYFNGVEQIFTPGKRVLKYQNEGYIPIGFFQMWHPIASEIDKYPQDHDGADLTDLQFSLLWKRNKRRLIPDMYVIHLDSLKNKKMGLNWKGRQAPVFGYSKMMDVDNDNRYEIK